MANRPIEGVGVVVAVAMLSGNTLVLGQGVRQVSWQLPGKKLSDSVRHSTEALARKGVMRAGEQESVVRDKDLCRNRAVGWKQD